jgi:Glycine/D-amino acid oxidases (deaminating)
MNTCADVIVIGSGITGCTAAYYLATKGVKVLVLEREMIGNGGSSRNGGGVRLSGRNPKEFPLAKDAIENIWPTLSDELDVDLEYRRDGNLRLAHTEEQKKKLENVVKESNALGLDIKIISGDEARKICPYLSLDIIAAAFCPTDGCANPMVTTLAFYRKARVMGVHFITGEKVVALRKYKGRARKVITESGNIYEAATIIVAAGYESRAIANTVGIDVPILKRIDECVVTEIQPPMFKQRISTPDGNFYGHQTNHGSFIFGGNTQLERYEKSYDGNARSTTVAAPDKCRAAMKYIPALTDAKIIRQWAGWLDSCVDRLPVIDKIPEVPGLILACAFSGHGFAIGPSVGKVLSELVLDEKVSVDITGLTYNRFKAAGCWS